MYWPVAILAAFPLVSFVLDALLTPRIISGLDGLTPNQSNQLLEERSACTKSVFSRIFRNAVAAFFVVYFTYGNTTVANVIVIAFIALSVCNIIGFIMDAVSIFAKTQLTPARSYVMPLQILWTIIMIACAAAGAYYMLLIRP